MVSHIVWLLHNIKMTAILGHLNWDRKAAVERRRGGGGQPPRVAAIPGISEANLNPLAALPDRTSHCARGMTSASCLQSSWEKSYVPKG